MSEKRIAELATYVFFGAAGLSELAAIWFGSGKWALTGAVCFALAYASVMVVVTKH